MESPEVSRSRLMAGVFDTRLAEDKQLQVRTSSLADAGVPQLARVLPGSEQSRCADASLYGVGTAPRM